MAFDLQPTLRGELLELRPFEASDFEDLFAVAADPLIWEQHPDRDRYKGMKQLMLQHAFRFVDRVVFLVGPANHRSQRALEKIGAVHLGSRVAEGGRERKAYQIGADTFRQDARWNSS